MLTDLVEAGRRVRAARGYANLSRRELAEACQLTLKQVRDLEEGTRTVTTVGELNAIARVCDVPPEFLHHGWRGTIALYEDIWALMALAPDVDHEALGALIAGRAQIGGE